jgi:hypothetical protein
VKRLPVTLAGTAALVAGVAVLGAGDTVSGYVATTSTPTSLFTAAADWTAPTVSAAVVAKAAGGDAGYVRPGGSYFVYASATDAGNPAAGIASVIATVSSLTASPLSAALPTGTATVDGVTYDRKSAALTVKAGLANGSYSFSLASTDSASPANVRNQAFTATVDGTAPTATTLRTTNVPGGILGRAERGDTAIFTSSEPLDAASILTGWNGTTTNVLAAIYYDSATAQDLLLIGAPGGTDLSAQLPLGTAALGRSDYVPANGVVYFGQTGTASSLTRAAGVITLTLGTASATATTAAGTGTTKWIPDIDATDRAGNAMSTTVATFTAKAF